jgi:hypothetical protein
LKLHPMVRNRRLAAPSNMLDFIGLIITTALMVLVVNTLIVFIDASRAAKVTLAAIIGIWIGLAAAVAQAGWLSIARPIPVVGLFVAVPILAAALAATWPAAREAMLSIPMPVMVALNVVRVFAVLFLMLAAHDGSPAHSRTAPRGATLLRA